MVGRISLLERRQKKSNLKRHCSSTSRSKVALGTLVASCTFLLRMDRQLLEPSTSLPIQRELSRSLYANEDEREQAGWKTIHVFVGDDKHFEVDKNAGSQVGQDRLVAAMLGNQTGGYFVDLAANDATFLSNSLRLELVYNWTGLCIEPQPHYWRRLSYRKCDVVAAVVGSTTMEEVDFRLHKDGGLSGIERPGFDNLPGRNNIAKDGPPTKFYTVTLLDILERMKAPPVIDYLSLDVEGAEYFIMEHFPFERYRVNIMTIERPNARLQELLFREGYVRLCKLSHWGETLWVRRSVLDRLDLTVLPSKCNATEAVGGAKPRVEIVVNPRFLEQRRTLGGPEKVIL